MKIWSARWNSYDGSTIKKISHLSLFIILTSLSALKGQVYHPFPDSNARWSQEKYILGASPGAPSLIFVYHGSQFALGNDTLINSLHYTLVGFQKTYYYEYYGTRLTSAVNYPITPSGQIFGAIREDSSRKVWFKKVPPELDPNFYPCGLSSQLPMDSEILLYDFNLELGDSILWGPQYFGNFKTVSAIDSVQFNGTYRKRYKLYFPTAGVEYWIESMGSTLGLFGAYQRAPASYEWILYDCWLNCFSQNDVYYYKKTPFPSNITCDATTLAPDLDAGITYILFPDDSLFTQLFEPKVRLSNRGSLDLTYVRINYRVDDQPPAFYDYDQPVAPQESVEVIIPAYFTGEGDHIFYAWTSDPNHGTDEIVLNDSASSMFFVTSAFPTNTITIISDPTGNHATITLVNPSGPTIDLRLVNTLGQIAMKGKWQVINNSTIALDMSSYANGLYFLYGKIGADYVKGKIMLVRR